jgi:hypothetical protein
MQAKYFTVIGFSILMLTIFSFSSVNVLACQYDYQPICAIYARAGSVFTGKLEKFEEGKSERSSYIVAYFSVEKTFKGTTERIEKVTFRICLDAGENDFKVGERYFVYKENADLNGYNNHPRRLTDNNDHLRYAEGLSTTDPIYTLSGRLEDLTEGELKNTEVSVIQNEKEYKFTPDEYGKFEYKATNPGLYKVRIVLPFDAKIYERTVYFDYAENLTVTNSERQTIIEYDSRFKPNDCDYRTFSFDKDYKIVLSKISGKIIDGSGNPVPNLPVYLYPNTKDQDFNDWNSRSGKTSQAGEYCIDRLKPGSYILGVNLGKTPRMDAPYPETYYPGRKTLGESQIINLTEGQNLSLQNLVLPPKLKVIKISGKLIWENGTAVTKYSPNSDIERRPIVYLVDPKNFLMISSFSAEGNSTSEIDNQGNFSFLTFERYSYIIHAHAFDSKNQPMHANHFLVKAPENLKPITLKLNLNGEGNSEEEIRRALISK